MPRGRRRACRPAPFTTGVGGVAAGEAAPLTEVASEPARLTFEDAGTTPPGSGSDSELELVRLTEREAAGDLPHVLLGRAFSSPRAERGAVWLDLGSSGALQLDGTCSPLPAGAAVERSAAAQTATVRSEWVKGNRSQRQLDGGEGGSVGAAGAEGIVKLNFGSFEAELVEQRAEVEARAPCNACPACADVCALAGCVGCALKRKSVADAGAGAGGANGKGKAQGERSYSMCEVRRHASASDCWLVCHGRVYDVTSYLSRHPAGLQSILRHGGKDSSFDFDMHSKGVQKMFERFFIGTLKPCPSTQADKQPPALCGVCVIS